MRRAILILFITLGLFAIEISSDFSAFTEELDLVFAMDTSGSMMSTIAGVRSDIVSMVEMLDSVGSDYKLGASTFADGANIWDYDEYTPGFQLTGDYEEFVADIDATGASGGGDGPETQLDAMDRAAFDYEWILGRARALVMFTDAPYHSRGDLSGYSELLDEELYNEIIRSGIPVFISSSSYEPGAQAFYDSLAINSGGESYPLSTSWDEIFEDIIETTDGYFFMSCGISELDPDAGLESITLEELDEFGGSPRTYDISDLSGVDELHVGWILELDDGLYKRSGIQSSSYKIRLVTSEGIHEHTGVAYYSIDGDKRNTKAENLSFEVYPNPFNSAVNIDVPDGAKVSIYNASGRLVKQSDNIDKWHPADDAESGIYMIKAEKDGQQLSKSLLYIK